MLVVLCRKDYILSSPSFICGRDKTTGEKTMASDVTIYIDDNGYPMGISGRATSRAQAREQFAMLRRLGVE